MPIDPTSARLPDWQLPAGVDRGLFDYLHSGEMAAGYDAMMAASPLAAADVAFCEAAFPTPGRLVDLGCGTGRLAVHFARKGYAVTGVDLSPEMLAVAAGNAAGLPVKFVRANLADLSVLERGSFEYAACLFSTLGMVRGADVRAKVLAEAFRVLTPGGRLVLHVHNRFFRGLRGRGLLNGDVTMPQAYGGAKLTIRQFTRREAVRALTDAGFRVERILPVGTDGRPRRLVWNAYGYLLLGIKPH